MVLDMGRKMANVKKQAKNAKTTNPDLQAEISKFEKEWYARPYADRIRKPAITLAISLSLTILFGQFSDILAGISLMVAIVSGMFTIGYALGGRPLTPTEQTIQNEKHHDFIYRGWAGNILNKDI